MSDEDKIKHVYEKPEITDVNCGMPFFGGMVNDEKEGLVFRPFLGAWGK